MTRIVGNRVIHGNQLEAVEVDVDGGTIVGVRTYSDPVPDLPLLLPGFIDLHVHGGGGADTMDGTVEAMQTIRSTHAKHGTTALLLTTVTDSPVRIERVLDTAETLLGQRERTGSQILGVHLEGPFIHPDKAGAQSPTHIINPSVELAERWFNRGVVKMMTLAPELSGAFDVARVGARFGVVMAAGHTTATARTMDDARAAGFSHITHLCNAMPGFHHRDVGPIGHMVVDPAYTGDLICDGLHVHPAMLTALARTMGDERLMLITDGIRAVDMGAGTYQLGDLPVYVANGECRLQDGTLAGSVLTMEEAFWKAHDLMGASLESAQKMAATNPAAKLGMKHKGRIEVGYDADLVGFDRDRTLLWTMVQGQYVYRKTPV